MCTNAKWPICLRRCDVLARGAVCCVHVCARCANAAQLMALIDYHGHRMIAMSILPIDDVSAAGLRRATLLKTAGAEHHYIRLARRRQARVCQRPNHVRVQNKGSVLRAQFLVFFLRSGTAWCNKLPAS